MNYPTRLLRIALLGAVCATMGAACARSNENVQAARENPNAAKDELSNKQALSAADKQFIKEAEKDNIAERSLGRMALQKSNNKDVKDYAQMLVDDHTKALNNLVDLMKDAGMPQPAGLPEAKHEAENKLSRLTGPAFDRAYIDLMVQEHQKDVAKFQKKQSAAQNESVRSYVEDVLPVLQKHLKEAQELQSKLNQASGTTHR